MKRRSTVPTAIAGHPRTGVSIPLPTDWTPEQAVAVFEILDALRERVWSSYGLQIQQVLREQCNTASSAADDIDEADVPF